MVTIDQIYDNILTQKFTWVKVLDSDGDAVASMFNSHKSPVTPQMVKAFIVEFVRSTPGIYTFQFKKHTTAQKHSIITYKKVSCHTGNLAVLSSFNEEEERMKIRKQLEEEERERKAKIDYEARAAELETSAGIMSFVMTKIFSSMGYLPQAKGNLQGTTTTSNMSNETIVPLDKLTEEQKKLVNDGFVKLLSVMSPELFHKVATKLYENPDKVSVIKTFL